MKSYHPPKPRQPAKPKPTASERQAFRLLEELDACRSRTERLVVLEGGGGRKPKERE